MQSAVSWFIYIMAHWNLLWCSQTNITGSACPPGLFGQDCLSRCHCLDDVMCDVNTGRCLTGCAERWDGPRCQRENVAFRRPAQQKNGTTSLDPGFAVDDAMDTCTRSKSGVPGWWRVTLSGNVTVYSVSITADEGIDIQGWNVYVGLHDNVVSMKLCTTARVSGTSGALPCDRPVNGNHVMIANRAGDVRLCDVKIYNCSPFWYGHDCSQMCNCADVTETCDPISGACATGCASGWIADDCKTPCRHSYGPDCMYECGHCVDNSPCDHVTGACVQGCQNGWTGIFCNQQCPVETFGPDCNTSCGHCYGVTSCDIITGNCLHGCKAGYMGPKCMNECPAGYYGEGCAGQCGACDGNVTCDPRIGVCHQGCQPGWRGAFCTQMCNRGDYGTGCLQTCRSCKHLDCHPSTGHCRSGCLQGYTGNLCSQVCQDGHYGDNCSSICGKCRQGEGRLCDVTSGVCQHGCLPGYGGGNCEDACDDGYYGAGCVKCGVCAPGTICDPITGACPSGCSPGFFGDLCTQSEGFSDETGSHLQVFLGVTLTVLALIVVLVSVCLVKIWRREQLSHFPPKRAPRGQVLDEAHAVADDITSLSENEAECETRFVKSACSMNGRSVENETEVMELV